MLNGFDACGGRPGRRPTISLTLRLMAATTFLVGCAASDDAGVIRLGIAGPMKEPSGKGMYQGALLAVEEINARGGVRGRPLELVVRDDEMNPVRAIEVAEEFRDRTDVVAVVGHLSSGASIAASEIYNEPGNGLLAISPGATSPEMSTTGEWTFRVCPSDLQQAAALAEWAFDGLGRRRTLIVYVNDAYGRGVRDAFTPAFEGRGGTVVSADPYLPDLLEDERALDPYLERGIRNGMDALVLVGMGDEVTAILRAARRLGFRGTVMGTDGLIGIAEAGSVAEDVVVTSGFLVDRATESARDFVQRYQRVVTVGEAH
jgi:branched-chain amino acid transport system substrate-binding protein